MTTVSPTEQLDAACELPYWKIAMEYSLGKYFTLLEGSTGGEIYVMEDAQSKSKPLVVIHFSFSVLNFGTARW